MSMVFRVIVAFIALCFLSACAKENSSAQSFESTTSRGFLCKAEVGPKAIYGSDDRLDWYESPGVTKDYWARASVALMPSTYLSLQEDGQYKVNAQSYGRAMNLCEGEKFYDQPSAAFCSGFLVSSNIVITAGHCLRSQSECDSTQFVFDYAKTEVSQEDYLISQESVYGCKEIIKRSVGKDDFAVVRLKRPVVDRTPLNVRRSGNINLNERLMLIGHPMGLPSKIAEGGRVMSLGDNIKASVDAFAANSGSMVLNMNSGLVEGILVAGEPDFAFQNGCRIEAQCDGSCQGETITPIGKLLQYIPDEQYENPVCESL